MNISPWRLLLAGLLGVALTLFLFWIYNFHPAWVWPWGATVLLLVIAALVAWAIVVRQRRRQHG